jgi:hypothetical protein
LDMFISSEEWVSTQVVSMSNSSSWFIVTSNNRSDLLKNHFFI